MLLRDGTHPIKQKAMFKKRRSAGAKMATGNKIIFKALQDAFAHCTQALPISAPIEGSNV
ncbi:hypothetical protein LRC39_11145 [Rhodopseudomonas sp. P1]|uniref:hypothetical protein n=1 Tax=Rhodopseudomonas sp. P1 TaxID=3434357 RepID=UPI0031FCA16C